MASLTLATVAAERYPSLRSSLGSIKDPITWILVGSIRRRQIQNDDKEAPAQAKVGVVVPTGFEPVFKP
jgi:hypothetical protein